MRIGLSGGIAFVGCGRRGGAAIAAGAPAPAPAPPSPPIPPALPPVPPFAVAPASVVAEAEAVTAFAMAPPALPPAPALPPLWVASPLAPLPPLPPAPPVAVAVLLASDCVALLLAFARPPGPPAPPAPPGNEPLVPGVPSSEPATTGIVRTLICCSFPLLGLLSDAIVRAGGCTTIRAGGCRTRVRSCRRNSPASSGAKLRGLVCGVARRINGSLRCWYWGETIEANAHVNGNRMVKLILIWPDSSQSCAKLHSIHRNSATFGLRCDTPPRLRPISTQPGMAERTGARLAMPSPLRDKPAAFFSGEQPYGQWHSFHRRTAALRLNAARRHPEAEPAISRRHDGPRRRHVHGP
jgi:hypothetical protein